MLPPPFVRQMLELLGPEEHPAFLSALQEPAPVSIRLRDDDRISAPAQGTKVPWHPRGYYLPERPVFTLDPVFHAGAYYVQEASSMFLFEALRQTVDFSKRLRVLDLCAAPGGKSTLVADMIGPDSLLVANEVIRTRVGALRENLEKWAVHNVAVTSAEAEDFAAIGPWFDLIVADAPCSGEGLFRKDPDAMREWSPAQVEMCSVRQRRILAAAVEALAPGGIFIYSTCTYNRQENEDNNAWMIRTFDLEALSLDIPPDWGIVQSGNSFRFFPHRTRGEGFFLAVFRKKDGNAGRQNPPAVFRNVTPLAKTLIPEARKWLNETANPRLLQTPSGDIIALPAAQENDYLVLDKFLKNKWFGTNVGVFKGKDFIPSHALALSSIYAPTLPALDLSREQALLFLKKETFDISPDMPRGWALARFQGFNLGWMKILPNRMNNYLPPERRIRMEIKGG